MKRSLKFKVLSITTLLLVIASVMMWFPAIYNGQSVSYAYQAVNRNVSVNGSYCGQAVSCKIAGTGAAFHQLTWNKLGTVSVCSVTVDTSADNVSWSTGGAITAKDCSTNGTSTSTSVIANYVRMTVTTFSGTGSVTLNLTGFLNNPSGSTGVTSFSGDGTLITNSASTGAVTATLGKTIPTGNIVGTTDTQTLTNKSLTTPVLTGNVAIGGVGVGSGVAQWNGNTSGTNSCGAAATGGTVSCTATWQSAALISTGTTTASTFRTGTNCTSSASPAVCGSAGAGSVVIAAAATSVVVNTTLVTANSQIFAIFDSSLGTKLSVTCNTTPALPVITARVANTSFTITVPAAPTTNPACYSWFFTN